MNSSQGLIRAYLLALLAIFFWSFNVIIASALKSEIQPMDLTFWRWTIAGVVLLPFILKSGWQARQCIRQNVFLLLCLGLLGVSAMNTLIYKAAHTASVIDIALLGTLGPIFLALILTLFFKKKMTLFQSLGMGISFLGVVVIICHGSLERLRQFDFVSGDLDVIIRNLIFAVYTILLGRKPKELSPPLFLGCTIFFGLLGLLSCLLIQGGLRPLSDYSMKTIALILYMGVFPSLIAFLCWNEAILQLGAMRTSLIYYLIPLLSVVEAYFLLGEMIGIRQIVGGAIVIGGILLSTRTNAYHTGNIHH